MKCDLTFAGSMPGIDSDVRPTTSRWFVTVAAPLGVASARTAVFQMLLARRDGVVPQLRLADELGEDLAPLMRDLEWLGCAFGSEPLTTSTRTDIYRAHVQQLVDAGRVKTDGPTSHLRVAPGHTVIDDAIKGPVTFDNAALGEIPLIDRNGSVDVAFAAAIDDALLGTPLVIREDRQLEHTARGLLILDALGLPAPRYAHVGSILCDTAGAELPSIASLRRSGFLPDVVISHLALLGWSPESGREVFGWPELVEEFTLERVSHGSAQFNEARLRALNARALRALSPAAAAALLATAMQRRGLLEDPIPDAAARWIQTFLSAYGTQFSTLGEALALVTDLRAEAVIVPALELEKLRNRQVLFYLDAVGQYVDAQPELRGLPLDHDLPVIAQEFGIAHDDAFAALRMALTGSRDGAPLGLLFPLLGHERILMRIGAISSHLLHGRGLEPIKFGPGGVPFETIQPTGPPEP